MVDGCVNNKEDLQEIESNIIGPIPSSSKPIIHITIVLDYNPNTKISLQKSSLNSKYKTCNSNSYLSFEISLNLSVIK